MNFRELNHKKNFWLSAQKTRFSKFLFDNKNNNHYSPSAAKTIKKILFLRHDNKFGDMIVSTIFYKNLKQLLPQAQITVLCGPATKIILENNKNVSAVYTYKKGWSNTVTLGLKLRKEKFDLIIDIDKELTAQTILLIRLIRARFVFGFNRDGYGIYNIKKTYTYGKEHISKIYKKVLEDLKIAPKDFEFDFNYSLPVPKTSTNLAQQVIKYLSKEGANKQKPLVIFNPFASSKHRHLTPLQAVETAQELKDYNFLIIGPSTALEKFLPDNQFKPNNLFLVPQHLAKQGGIMLSIALLREADYLISPDTYIVHAARALNKPQLCIYRGNDKENIITWGPYTDNAVIAESTTDNKDLSSKTIIENFLKLVKKDAKH